MKNSGNRCTLQFWTKNGKPIYHGNSEIDGVFGSSAPVMCKYRDLAGSACGRLFPTNSQRDRFGDIEATCIDNGMPVVCIRAKDLEISGNETPQELNKNFKLRQRLEALRIQAGFAMGLGDVSSKVIPKMCLVSKPAAGGFINTRTFIPHQCHDAIGVLGAISVASASLFENSIIQGIANITLKNVIDLAVEHPSGKIDLQLVTKNQPGMVDIESASLLRTTRLLARGEVYVPTSIWNGTKD